ncbi:Enhancer of rudimentary protein, putative [Theobroma cacao]|uniref:Enhancer of rudimentary protein, putative n=1 Tax=Theobroma cacao TaxID=3641 RepID=S1S450_THECC|nr:Enhancer of rudimentary protein, putative [Theobroma cacao]
MLPLLANRHTIVLMQTSQNRAPRTFVDYDSISQAMDIIRELYERKLKKLNPATQNITYDIGVLYNFIDGLADMIALVQKGQFKWMPFHHVIKDCDFRRTFTRPWSH